MVASLDHLVEGQDRSKPWKGVFAFIQFSAVKGEGQSWPHDGAEDNSDIGQDEEKRLGVFEGVIHFIDKTLEEALLSIKERLVVFIWSPVSKAHASEHNGAQTHEGQDEQRCLDPGVGGMNVRCNVGFGRTGEGLQPHAGHVEARHGGTQEHAHGRVEEPGIIQSHTPGVGDDAFFRPEATDEREAHDGKGTDQHGGCREGHL